MSETTFQLPDILVLAADHSMHVRRILRDVLARSGVKRVLEACDGAEAIEMFTTATPDLVIMDWDLPMLSGEECVHMIRNQKASPSPKVPVMMMLSQPQKSTVDRAIRNGVTDILIKPFSPKTLCQRMDAIIRNPSYFVEVGGVIRSTARLASGAKIVNKAPSAGQPAPAAAAPAPLRAAS